MVEHEHEEKRREPKVELIIYDETEHGQIDADERWERNHPRR